MKISTQTKNFWNIKKSVLDLNILIPILEVNQSARGPPVQSVGLSARKVQEQRVWPLKKLGYTPFGRTYVPLSKGRSLYHSSDQITHFDWILGWHLCNNACNYLPKTAAEVH